MALMAHANLVDAYERLGESERATEHCLAIGRTTPWGGTADYQPLFKRPPTYPRAAQVRGLEGYVLLEFTVDRMGFVRDPSVVDSGVSTRPRPGGEQVRCGVRSRGDKGSQELSLCAKVRRRETGFSGWREEPDPVRIAQLTLH